MELESWGADNSPTSCLLPGCPPPVPRDVDRCLPNSSSSTYSTIVRWSRDSNAAEGPGAGGRGGTPGEQLIFGGRRGVSVFSFEIVGSVRGCSRKGSWGGSMALVFNQQTLMAMT